MEIHKLLKLLQEENKQLKEVNEDQEVIIGSIKLENEMMKARLAKIGVMTTRQELRARIVCALFARNPNHIVSRLDTENVIDYILTPEPEVQSEDQNTDPKPEDDIEPTEDARD